MRRIRGYIDGPPYDLGTMRKSSQKILFRATRHYFPMVQYDFRDICINFVFSTTSCVLRRICTSHKRHIHEAIRMTDTEMTGHHEMTWYTSRLKMNIKWKVHLWVLFVDSC